MVEYVGESVVDAVEFDCTGLAMVEGVETESYTDDAVLPDRIEDVPGAVELRSVVELTEELEVEQPET